MNRRKVFGLLAIIAVVVSIGSAAACGGFFAMDTAGGNAVLNAIKAKDFDAWKTAATNANSPLLSKITSDDQFKLLVQLYQAKQDGNYSKVKELSQQLGLSMGNGRLKMYGHFGR